MRLLQTLFALFAAAKDSERARMVEYLKAENKILRDKLPKRLTVTARERARLLKLETRLVAVAHTQLVIVSHVLKEGTTYRELGADYFDRLDTDRATRELVRRLEPLGHTVTLTAATPRAIDSTSSQQRPADRAAEPVLRSRHSEPGANPGGFQSR
jgi:hypothetical protein